MLHPDRQAANVLKLFEGSRAAHPAAALAAWKRATRDPAQLGKTLEAFIALVNPEMVREWQTFHDAELRMNLNPNDGTPIWQFVVPHDDGTASAMIAAFRLSDLEDPPPIVENGQEYVVAGFIRAQSTVLTHVGRNFVLASSREELGRAIQRLDRVRSVDETAGAEPVPHDQSKPENALSRLAGTLSSGLALELRPPCIVSGSGGSLEVRRAIEVFKALGCEQILGRFAVEGERLFLDVMTRFEASGRPSAGTASLGVDPTWLKLLPAQDLIAVVSLAVDPHPRFWDRVFAIADQVERVDVAYRNSASLRTRFNLLAKGGGLQPEVKLWPHLRGVTVAAIGDPEKSGRLAGGVAILHADTPASAADLANEFIPRLARLGKGKLTLNPTLRADHAKSEETRPGDSSLASSATHRLGRLGGRSLAVRRVGLDVLIGWGDETAIKVLGDAGKSSASPAGVCANWASENKPAPSRVAALWPGRLGLALPASATLLDTPPARVLGDDPPVIWWGWNENAGARDVVFWADLRRRVSRFLDVLPMDPPPYR
jgi:hypothetical protein